MAAISPAHTSEVTGLQRFMRNRVAVAALVILGILVMACAFGPMLLSQAGAETSAHNFKPPGFVGEVTVNDKTSVVRYPFGTDLSGRDLLRRVLEGGRVSLLVGALGALLSLIIGTAVGLVAGFLGGWVDAVMMRTVDVLYSIPRLLFMLVVISALDEPLLRLISKSMGWAQANGHPSLADWLRSLVPVSRIALMIFCLGFIEWLTMARIVRGQVLVLREQTYVAAARVLGRSRWQIMWLHLLPNLMGIILTYLTLTIPVVILDESFLSFLGLGIEEPASSWGALLKEGSHSINPLEMRWWMLIFPASFMTVTLLCLNFVGDGLRDAFDVK
jgi:oligopeptide transport system permease protein